MEIRQFMYVSMAAECGSFTKAAEKLFITQPALSSYISKLEEELGVRLFDRSVTPLGLTYAGEKYLAYAEIFSGRQMDWKGRYGISPIIWQNTRLRGRFMPCTGRRPIWGR